MASYSRERLPHPLFASYEDDYGHSHRVHVPPPPPPAAASPSMKLAQTNHAGMAMPTSSADVYASYGGGYYPQNHHDVGGAATEDGNSRDGNAPLRRHDTDENTKRQPPAKRSTWSAFWSTLNTTNQIAYLSVLMFQTAAVLSLIVLIYATISDAVGDITSEIVTASPQTETVTTYLSLFIIATIFEIMVTMDALLQKNIIQLFFLVLFQIAMIVYSSFLPSQLRAALVDTTANTPSVQSRIRVYAIVIPAVIGGVTCALAGLTWRLYGEFGWDVFKRIGADINLKRMYFRYQIFVCLLKFTAFVIIGFEIQFLVLVSGTPTAEFVITIVALPVAIVCLILAAVAVRQEIRAGVYAFFVLVFAGLAYFLYKLVRIYNSSSSDRYDIARKTLTIFSILSFVMLLITFVMTGLCLLNFDKGLKTNIPPYTYFLYKKPNTSLNSGKSRKSSGLSPAEAEKVERQDTRMSLD